MAWRDSRRERRKLVLFSSSIIFGIAALVAIGSLKENLQSAVADQAKALLGADVAFTSRREMSDETRAKIEALAPPADRAREVSFGTMILFPKNNGTRIVNIRATDPGFPFYGEATTDPPEAWEAFRKGEAVIVEQSVMEQFDVKVGDQARIGLVVLPVAGSLVVSPPRASNFSALAPQIFLPYAEAAKTGLLGDRSLTSFRTYLRLPEGTTVPDLQTPPEEGVKAETAADRQRRLGRALDNLYSFFALTGFIALLLGGIGVASAIHVHVSGRIRTVATLACLGCPPSRAFAVFLVQGMALGILGTLGGVALGLLIQRAVPVLFAEQLPFPVDFALAPGAILSAVAIGFFLCLAFSLFPLIRVRRVSPLAAIRSDVAPTRSGWRDPLTWLCVAALVGVLLLVAYQISPPKQKQLGFGLVIALAIILGALALAGKAIMRLARLIVRRRWPYTARQGLANLHRPRNQTLLFLLSAGLGSCLIMTLLLAENLLRAQLDKGSIRGKSNVFIIDVRTEQRAGVEKILADLGLESLESASLVTMRLSGIHGKTMKEIQDDPKTRIPNWVLRRDLRSTFREKLEDSETLLEGEWVDRFDRSADPQAPVPVSVEEGIAREMKIKLGDTFAVEIEGKPMDLKVANLRKVEWDSMGLNFFLIFPLGTLEDAPAMGVVTTRVDAPDKSASLQSRAVREFPNVTIIDVTAIFQTIRSILDKIAYVIRFMALFTVVTGAFILVAVILAGKRARVAESVLLRTLGASRKQVRAIFLTEYFLLGTFSALAGALLAVPAGWAVARFAFKVDFLAHSFPLWSVGGATVLITVLAGLLLSRGITSHPPLAILREE